MTSEKYFLESHFLPIPDFMLVMCVVFMNSCVCTYVCSYTFMWRPTVSRVFALWLPSTFLVKTVHFSKLDLIDPAF